MGSWNCELKQLEIILRVFFHVFLMESKADFFFPYREKENSNPLPFLLFFVVLC